MAMTNMEQFTPSYQKFDEWMERLEFYFDVNDIKAEKKVSWLLTLVGGEVYSVLKSLLNPEKPSAKSYYELVKILLKHYEPEVNVISERYKFNTRIQESYESLTDYIVELRNLASTCDFGKFLNDALRDRFVCGIENSVIQCALLQKTELTFETACQTAIAMELTEAQMKVLKPVKPVENSQNAVVDNENQLSNKREKLRKGKKCTRCARFHNPDTCPAKEWQCYVCKEKGHTSVVCPKKTTEENSNES